MNDLIDLYYINLL